MQKPEDIIRAHGFPVLPGEFENDGNTEDGLVVTSEASDGEIIMETIPVRDVLIWLHY